MSHKRRDKVTFGGVIFRFGKLVWQDSFSAMKTPVGGILSCAHDGNFPQHESYGYVAKVGKAMIIITETSDRSDSVDATLVALGPRVRFEPK